MSFDKIHAARLTQLADRLDSDVPLLVGRFDFKYIYEMAPCGSTGCALGEAAMLWPNDLHLVQNMDIGAGCSYRLNADAVGFFGISQREHRHLFVPGMQQVDDYGGAQLTGNATRHEVAANIRAFLAVKGAQEGTEA